MKRRVSRRKRWKGFEGPSCLGRGVLGTEWAVDIMGYVIRPPPAEACQAHINPGHVNFFP